MGELRDLLQERSIQTDGAPYTLSSGLTSNYYCDTKATILSPRGARLIGEVIFDRLHTLGVEAVGGLAMGSLFISTAVSLISEERRSPIYGFFVRPQAKGHGLRLEVEQSYHPSGEPLLRRGRSVAVVDDVVTVGGSIGKAIDAVRNIGCDIRAVIAIVDRESGGGDKLRSEGLPYEALFSADQNGRLSINGPSRAARRIAPVAAHV
jgi:orotate phosphoribosyltransferase